MTYSFDRSRKYLIRHIRFLTGLFLAVAVSVGADVSAKTPTFFFDIKGQDVGAALVELSRGSGVQILMANEAGKDITVAELRGEYTLDQALQKILRGTGLIYRFYGEKTVIVRPKADRVATVVSAAKPHKETLVDETLITAKGVVNRFEGMPISNTYAAPASIVAVDDAELAKRGIKNFEALGLAVPGLSVSDGSNGNGRRVFIRGVGNYSGSSSLVGIYLDELPLTTNPLWQFDIRPYDLERIEVLRGPQGTQFGQGAVGGTVRFIAKQPDLSGFAGRADVSLALTAEGDSSQEVKGVINVPLIEQELGLRVVGMFNVAGGWIDQPAAGKGNINDEQLADIRIKSLWTPSNVLSVSVMANARRNNLGAASVGEDENGNYTQALGFLSTPSSSDDYEVYNLALNYDFGTVHFLSATGYISTGKCLRDNTYRVSYLPPPTPLFEAIQSDDVTTRVFSQEFRLNSAAAKPWRWTVGAFYEEGDFNRDIFYSWGQQGTSVIRSTRLKRDESFQAGAFFTDSGYRIADRVEVGAGLRYLVDDRQGFDGAVVQTQTFRNLSPRVYLNVDVSDYLKLYVSAAEGFRSGGFNEAALAPPFGAESVRSYELGTKMSLLGGQLDGELALFYSRYDNYQIVDENLPPNFPDERPFATQANAGSAEIRGVDWAFTWQASDNLSFASSGNYVDTGFVRINAQSSSYAVGDRVDFIPRYSYTFAANIDFDWNGRPGFVRLDYFQKGRSTFRNRTVGEHLHGASDVINMLNFRAGWRKSERFSLGFFVHNILDERGNIDPWVVIDGAARPRPRTVGFDIGIEF